MTLDDAIFNWLQIRHVAEKRPDDTAAKETYQFFSEILQDDFKLKDVEDEQKEGMYVIYFTHENEKKEKRFPIEFVHQLLQEIENEPKYNG
jgi:hypothetical protein